MFLSFTGIMTDREGAERFSKWVSFYSGQKVEPMINDSYGIIKDVKEVADQHLNRFKDDGNSQISESKIMDAIINHKKLKIYAHSQGAAQAARSLNNVERQLIHFYTGHFKSEADQIKSDPKQIKSEAKKLNDNDFDIKARQEANKIMSEIEVYTIGAAAALDNFPNVKLIQMVNDNDLVPKIAGFNTFITDSQYKAKTYCGDKISIVPNKNPEKDWVTPTHGSYLNAFVYDKGMGRTSETGYKQFDKVKSYYIDQGLKNIYNFAYENSTGIAVYDDIVALKKLYEGAMVYHLLEGNKYAYGEQPNVRNVIFNSGRIDVPTNAQKK